MRTSILFFLIYMISAEIYGQSDYYVTDSTRGIGIKLIYGNDLINSSFCQVKQGKNVIQYTPYEVKEYGFEDGRVYLSKKVLIGNANQKVFLERLVKGNTTLYYYRGKEMKKYFLEKDSTLFVELPENDRKKKDINFNSILLDLTSDCPEVADATKLVRHTTKSLSKLITRYNNCESKPFPFLKYGLIAGYGAAKLIPSPAAITDHLDPNDFLNQIDYKYDGGFVFGAFIDNPIMVSNFSAHIELYYSKNGFSFNKQTGNTVIDLVVNTSTLNVPTMIRYTYPSDKIRPFINSGGYFAYNLRNNSAFYEAIINQSTIETKKVSKNSLIPDSQIGYSIGGGVEYKINYKKSLFIELRYNKLYSSSSSESLNKSEIYFFTAINF